MLSSGAGHVPALSVPLPGLPSSQESGCPQLEPARGELEAVSFHHRTVRWRLMALEVHLCPDETQLRRSDGLGGLIHGYGLAG